MAYPTVLPTLTARVVNPIIVGNKYRVDLEIKADAAVKLQGANVRFFFDSTHFAKTVKFVDFTDGYGPLSPTAATGVTTGAVGNAAAKALFGFEGNPTYVNGAIDLKTPAKAVDLSQGYVRICTIELDMLKVVATPPIVLDMEQNPAAGGFLPGSAGFVMASVYVKDVNKGYSQNRVEHLNWHYVGDGTTLPYGVPN